MYVSVNGKIAAQEDASVPAVTDGLYYGAGCFETFKSYHGSFLHFDQHIDRLNSGLKFLSGSDDNHYSAEVLRNEILNLLNRNKLSTQEAVIRIQAFIGDRIGYISRDKPQIQTVITSHKLNVPAGTLALDTSANTVVPATCKPAHLKLSNMLHYRQAGITAKNNGADDALMLTVNGIIAETSIANLFWESGSVVYTPSAACDILPGIMRTIVIKLLQRMGVQVEEGEYPRSDIMKSRQVWITNSVREVIQVSQIDSQKFNTNTKLVASLEKELKRYKRNHLK